MRGEVGLRSNPGEGASREINSHHLLGHSPSTLPSPRKNGERARRGTPTSVILLPPLARQGCQRAAFAIARVLEVDPVVGIDALERNVVARAQHLHEDLP